MKTKLTFFSLLLLIASCSRIGPTDNELRGIKYVANAWGGEYKYAKGWKTHTGKYFELELKNSNGIEEFKNNAGIAAAGIAYTFYRQLEEEKNNYEAINPVLIFKNGNKETFSFRVTLLDSVKPMIKLGDEMIRLMQERRYDKVYDLWDPARATPGGKDSLTMKLRMIDSLSGNVKENLLIGFEFVKIETGEKMLHVISQQNRYQGRGVCHAFFDPLKAGNNLVGFHYQGLPKSVRMR